MVLDITFFSLSFPACHVFEIPFRRGFLFWNWLGFFLWLRGQLDFSCEMSWIIKFGEYALDLISWIPIDFFAEIFLTSHKEPELNSHPRLQPLHGNSPFSMRFSFNVRFCYTYFLMWRKMFAAYALHLNWLHVSVDIKLSTNRISFRFNLCYSNIIVVYDFECTFGSIRFGSVRFDFNSITKCIFISFTSIGQ